VQATIKRLSLKLIVNEKGEPLSASAMRSRFDSARDAAVLQANDPKLIARIREFQFRDLRAKAGTDKEGSGGKGEAKDLLGHADEKMTTRYVRHRIGKRVSPTRQIRIAEQTQNCGAIKKGSHR
jgi:integrase